VHEEHAGEGDTGGNWTTRPRYDIWRRIELPFQARPPLRFCGLFPEGTELCYSDGEESDDWMSGIKPLSSVWDVAREELVLWLPITVLLPWESSEETVARTIPGWEFELDVDRSKGFERRSQV
jgi:hypothetical protein